MTGITISADSGTEFTANASEYNSVCRLDDTHYAVVYRDNTDGNKGKINVGSRTGTSITVSESNAVVFFSSACKLTKVSAMSSSLVIIGYVNAVTGNSYVVAATISGSTATVGTPAQVDNGNAAGTGVSVASLDGTYFVSAATMTGANALYCFVGSISGTTITLGSAQSQVLSSTYGGYGTSIVSLDATHAVIAYLESNTSIYRIYTIAVVANTGAKTLGFGAAVQTIDNTVCDVDSYPVISSFGNNSFVAGGLYGATNTIYVNGGTVSATTITVGTKLATVNTSISAATYSIVCMNTNSFLLSYYTTTGTEGELVGGTISGNQVSWDAQGAVIFDNATTAYTSLCFLATGYFILGYKSG